MSPAKEGCIHPPCNSLTYPPWGPVGSKGFHGLEEDKRSEFKLS